MTTRRIESFDANMGTAEIAAWCAGDRVEYNSPNSEPGKSYDIDGRAFDHVMRLLARSGLTMEDDGEGWLVVEKR